MCNSSNTRQLGCVFQDMAPPKSSSILRKSSDIRKPIRRVKFTQAVARHAYIRDQNPSLGYICPGEPHQRSPNAPKFEDRSQEETEWQEQGAREAAWKLAKSVLKLKEKNKATFLSPSENRCLPASNLKPEEREFVVDSGASMHMISKKDLNAAEMDTLTKSCSPTIVITAKGEVQTHEEATVYDKELDMFLTMKVENTPAVLSLGKVCDENGYSYEWINGQKPHLILKRDSDTVQHGELRSDRGSRLVNEFFIQFSSFNLHDTFKTGEQSSYIFLKLVFFTNYNSIKRQGDSRKGRFECHPVPVSSPNVEKMIERGDPFFAAKPAPLCSDIREWLQEFRENLVDVRVTEHRDSHASSSHEPSLEPMPAKSVDLGNFSVYIHLPKDRNCEICQRTKTTRPLCRRRTGGAVPRAENFGDLITADHKVLNESCESRNNHRYAIMVQDKATHWIQSYPCKTKTSQDLQNFLEPDRKPKVIYADNSLEFGKVCEDLSWNHCTSTPHRDRRLMGLLKEQCAE